MNTTIETMTSEDVERFTQELGDYARAKIPGTMSNAAFAASSAALMIAFNRQLASCAVAFGETHGIDAETVRALVITQFENNHRRALEAVNSGTIQ